MADVSLAGQSSPERDARWRELIRRMARGDENALAEMYDSSSSLVYALVLRIIGDRANAEEVMLDVYSQMWRSAARYDGTRGTPLAWMVTLARTRAIDRLRYAKHRAKHEDVLDRAATLPATTPTPERAAQSAEERRRVEEAIALLPDEQRVLVQLGFFAGLSHTEIAERLGVPLGTVKTRIRMAMVKLRETLKT